MTYQITWKYPDSPKIYYDRVHARGQIHALMRFRQGTAGPGPSCWPSVNTSYSNWLGTLWRVPEGAVEVVLDVKELG